MKHRQKQELFHVKHHPDRPHFVPFPCAPESLPEAAGLVLRMFQLHARRSSPVGSILRLVRLNLSKPAGIGPFTGFKYARPSNPSEALT